MSKNRYTMLLIPVLGLLQGGQKLIRGQMRISDKAYGCWCYSTREESENRCPACSREKLLGLLKRTQQHGASMSWFRSSLEVVFPPLWWCCVQGTGTVPCFCSRHPASAVGLWPFCILLFIIAPTVKVCSYV